MDTTMFLSSSLVALLAAVSGCSGDSVSCGPGTREDDGVCVYDGPGDADQGDGDENEETDDSIADGTDEGDEPQGDQPGAEDQIEEGEQPAEEGEQPAEEGEQPVAPEGELTNCDAEQSCADVARQIFDAINASRAASGACGGAALEWSDGCATVALGHASFMSIEGQMSADDGGIGDRLDAADVSWSSAGEVYGRLRGGATGLVRSWADDADTAAYVHSCEYTLVGVGAAAATGGQGPAWVTVTLITP